MELAALRAQQAAVDRLTDQGVTETVEGPGWAGLLRLGGQPRRPRRRRRPAPSSSSLTTPSAARSISWPSTEAATMTSRAGRLSRSARERISRSSASGSGALPSRPSRQPAAVAAAGHRCRAARPPSPPGTAGCRPRPRRRLRAPRRRRRRPGASGPGLVRRALGWGRGPGPASGAAQALAQPGFQFADPGVGLGPAGHQHQERAVRGQRTPGRLSSGARLGRTSAGPPGRAPSGPWETSLARSERTAANVTCCSSAGAIRPRCAPPGPGAMPIMCASTGKRSLSLPRTARIAELEGGA